MKFEFKRKNHLKSKIIIDELFSKGKAITKPPFRLVFLEIKNSEFVGIQSLISVPKRRFKLAVSRNSIKRKIGEAYRLNSLELQQVVEELNKHIAIGFIYIGKRELKFSDSEIKMKNLLLELSLKLKKSQDEE